MQPGPWQLRSLSRLFLCLPGAIEDANQAVRLHPLSEQLISRAIVLSALMKPNEALPDCDLAISKNPKSNLAYATRASIYLKINRTTEARNDLEKAFTLEDNKQTVYICHLLMVQSLYEASIGQFDLGISTVTQALELIDTSSNGYINRGWYYILKRQPKDALSDFDRAELYDKSPLNMSIVQSNRARAFTLLGDLPQAMKFANEGLELNVRGTTLCARAICFFLNEDYENALADLDKSIELEPHELEAYWYKAKIMRHREDEDQAIENERKTAGFEHLFQF
ncbi:MAG: hypothetical protein HYX67_16805 [Candidatus Melainabacteria bacterium]|nr:hypothetical protein [Candidatus Melainabacteria bacterium]